VTYEEYREYLDSVWDDIKLDALEALYNVKVKVMTHDFPPYFRLVMKYYTENRRISPKDVRARLLEEGYSVSYRESYEVLERAKRAVDGYEYEAKSDVTYYYKAEDEYGNSVPSYVPVSDGREVGEFITVALDESGMRMTVWHPRFDYESMAEDIADMFLEIADQQAVTRGVMMIYTGLSIDDVYRIVYKYALTELSFERFAELVDEYLRKNPLARRDVVSAYLRGRGIRVNPVWLTRAIQRFRRENADLVVKAIDRLVKRILSENPRIGRKRILQIISSYGMVIPKEFVYAFNASLSRYAVSREEFIRNVMKRLYSRNKKRIKSVNMLVNLYRSRGYKGTNAVLWRIAKEVMGKMGV